MWSTFLPSLMRRSLIALLVMILKPYHYEQDAKHNKPHSICASHKLPARKIAQQVLKHLGLTLKTAYAELHTGDRYDPGPVIDLGDSLAEFQVIPPATHSAT